MKEYSSVDINVSAHQYNIKRLLDLLKNDKFDYVKEGETNILIFEMILVNLPLDMLLCRFDDDKTIVENNHYDYGYKVYRGNGFLRTLDYYIIQDMPMTGFHSSPELNGKRFSEWPRRYQRRIFEFYITMMVDVSFKDDDIVIWDYALANKAFEQV